MFFVAEDQCDVVVDFFGRVGSHVEFGFGAAGDRIQGFLYTVGVYRPGDVCLTWICEDRLFPFVCGERGKPVLPNGFDFFGRHDGNEL